MARVATVLIVCLFASACATYSPTPTVSPRSFPPDRALLRAAFERLGATFQERTGRDGTKILEATNSVYGTGNRAFMDVSIYGDPVRAVSLNLPGFTMDSAGGFTGSAFVDVMDTFDPGVKRWYVAQSSDPKLEGLGREINLNGLVAQIPPIRLPGITVLVVETPPAPTPSN